MAHPDSSTGNNKAKEVWENVIGVAQCAFKMALATAGNSMFHRDAWNNRHDDVSSGWTRSIMECL